VAPSVPVKLNSTCSELAAKLIADKATTATKGMVIQTHLNVLKVRIGLTIHR
jgi:hypothetical protein